MFPANAFLRSAKSTSLKWFCLGVAALIAANAQAEEKSTDDKPKFLRLNKDADGKPLALQTSVARYVSQDGSGVVVDLIGAVHIGEDAYYKELNKRFKQYDAVMYELVAPEGTRIKKGSKGTGSAVSGLQNSMKDLLELEFQLEKIDYSPKNFVHADMTPTEFADDMKKRGDSFFMILGRAMGQGLVQQAQGGPSDTAVMMAMFSKDRAKKLRRIFAEQIQNVDGSMKAIDGPNGSTLITQRNIKALDVMQKTIDQGEKKIAVFYGAGHLGDMHDRLVNDSNMKLQSTEWLDAWDLR